MARDYKPPSIEQRSSGAVEFRSLEWTESEPEPENLTGPGGNSLCEEKQKQEEHVQQKSKCMHKSIYTQMLEYEYCI